jgi:hypothetical protein
MRDVKLLKLMPLLTVVGFLAYAAYSIESAPPSTTSSGAGPSSDASRISATDPRTSSSSPMAGAPAPDSSTRDPFRTEAAEAEAAAKLSAKELDPPPPPPPASPPDPYAAIVQQLVLNATFRQGRTRMAIINGRLYRQGQHLKGSDATPSPLFVADVLPMEVVLQANGRRYVLAYPDKFDTPASKGGSGPAASQRDEPPGDADLEGLGSQPALTRMLFGSPLATTGSPRTRAAEQNSTSSRRSVSQPPGH